MPTKDSPDFGPGESFVIPRDDKTMTQAADESSSHRAKTLPSVSWQWANQPMPGTGEVHNDVLHGFASLLWMSRLLCLHPRCAIAGACYAGHTSAASAATMPCVSIHHRQRASLSRR